ncbi:TrmH family RNA methyltransferase [Microbacterium sp.]|uniref:TrmH family RNA methyltransferase n=1 Tax=Microbacterium sp. TaxID=51671 RepID=UPI003F97D2F2
MHIEHVADASDPRLADYRNLTDTALRRVHEPEQGLYIAESVTVIERAVGSGHAPRSVLVQERRLARISEILGDQDVPVYVAPDAVIEQVTGFAVHRGALASMRRPELPGIEALLRDVRAAGAHSAGVRSRIAIFEDVFDHANIGAGFRSAAAFGVDAVLVTPNCADPLYRRAIRVSMGTVFQVPWTRASSWPDAIGTLRDAGYVVAGLTLGADAITLDDLVAEDHERLALVFGNEGHGLLPATDTAVDRRVTIPMMGGVDSLNVAASSAVAFHATK